MGTKSMKDVIGSSAFANFGKQTPATVSRAAHAPAAEPSAAEAEPAVAAPGASASTSASASKSALVEVQPAESQALDLSQLKPVRQEDTGRTTATVRLDRKHIDWLHQRAHEWDCDKSFIIRALIDLAMKSERS
jgi:hypothetical protein